MGNGKSSRLKIRLSRVPDDLLFLYGLLCFGVVSGFLTSHVFAWEAANRLTNHWSQPPAIATYRFESMKQFSEFATLAVASGGSAPSR